MKKFIYVLTAGMLLFAGCSQIDAPRTGVNEIAFNITATLDDLDVDEATRASTSTVIRLNWNAGDHISVVNLSTGKALGGDLVAQRAGSTTEFSGTLTGSISSGDVLGFIYPAQGYTAEQDFTVASISIYEQNGMPDEDKFVVTSKMTWNGQTEFALTFAYQVSFHLVSLTNLPANATINEISMTGFGNTVNLAINSTGKDFVASTNLDRITVKPASAVSKLDDQGSRFFFLKIPANSPANNDRKVKVTTTNSDWVGTYYSNSIGAGKFTNRIVKDFAEFTYIEDPIFETYLMSNFDLNSDGILSQAECDAVTRIDCAGYEELDSNGNWVADHSNGIKSIKGVEKFKNLKYLYCGINELTSLDVSQNTKLDVLSCHKNHITELDLRNNPLLTGLHCLSNHTLSSIDVSQNPKLVWLNCQDNNLTEIDVTHNPMLACLYSDANNITSYDLTQNIALTDFSCGSNSISSLDLRNNVNLKKLYCQLNNLSELDLSRNTALEILHCTAIKITELDLSNNTALKDLRCEWNDFSAKGLDLSHNPALEILYCKDDNLTSLNVSENTNIREIYCDDNHITSLDVSNNTSLEKMGCWNNSMENLVLGDNSRVYHLMCDNNRLRSLDLSKLTNLLFLTCRNNQLQELNLSNNSKLCWLECQNNQFASLDLTHCWFGDCDLDLDLEYPIRCGSSYLRDVYLLNGWSINGLTYNRSTNCINAEATIHLEDNPTDTELEL